MSYCLFCHQSYSETWSWAALFGLNAEPLLCQSCSAKLELIKGEICRICGRSFSLFPEQYRQGDFCYDCIRWEEDEEWTGVLQQNRSLYVYNDFLKEVIAKIKYRGDAELFKAFSPVMTSTFKSFTRSALLVPIPLSEERQYERGFNQAEIFAQSLTRNVYPLLKRVTHEEKQSKKTRKDRMAKKNNPFLITDEDSIKNKSILLIDDVYTTGSTLRYAAKVLKDAGADQISSITLAR
ncbi:ComF family protein [Fictibacillus phosphorivorans]|uniref:ComF family protein n=1 Tax=Fictibacillus phosphorivorans TaxID=1221500 RepID=UPI00203F6182|nr:ComF family protein [Fictibacillus phosphorivorans]MCM3718471.1 ComF family protein [Fictibacillus phosphorivorans]MCM3776173.1 ComF family protein [Fictibacillus phosphorivorans]